MEYSLTLAAIKKFDPCEDSFLRLAKILPKNRKITAQQARYLGCTYDDIIWIASAVAQDDLEIKKRLIAYINDNAKAVLHIFEAAVPKDNRVRECIQATDDFLDGKISEETWSRDARAAWAAWPARDARAGWAAWATWAAWDAWAAWAARAAWDAGDAFHDWQFDRLIYWLSDKNPSPLPMPEKGVPALPDIEAIRVDALKKMESGS